MNVSRLAVSKNNMQTIVITLRLFDCCVPSVKKYRLGTSKCHDHDIFTLQQPIRLQHFERGNEKYCSCQILQKCANTEMDYLKRVEITIING